MSVLQRGGAKAIGAMPIWRQHISKRGFPKCKSGALVTQFFGPANRPWSLWEQRKTGVSLFLNLKRGFSVKLDRPNRRSVSSKPLTKFLSHVWNPFHVCCIGKVGHSGSSLTCICWPDISNSNTGSVYSPLTLALAPKIGLAYTAHSYI